MAEITHFFLGQTLSHRIIDESVGDFDEDVPAQVALDGAAAALDALIARSGVDRALVRAVGVGVPGPVDERTGMLHAGSILASWVGADVPGGLEQRLSLPTYIDNDANLGALAESTFGGAVGARTALYVLLSVGVGLGMLELSDRILVMTQGAVTDALPTQRADRAALLAAISRGAERAAA